MSRTAYLDCVGGLAGDMLLAALLDAGGDPDMLQSVPTLLGLDDVSIETERVERQGIRALRVHVRAPDPGRQVHYRELRDRVAVCGLDEDIRERSLLVLQRLAEVEAHVHGMPVDEVHFHELGGADLLVDVCGALALVKTLELDRVACSAIPFSRGLIQSAHGVLPSPAPATVELLKGVPHVGVETKAELVTPTGAAVAQSLVSCWGQLPPLTLEQVGYGAGARDLSDRPNVLRVLMGTDEGEASEVALLETNLDDLSPELVPDAVEQCFAAGALDVWISPVQMKKGRPGVVLSALARPTSERAVARALLRETSALGLRVSRSKRYELDRDETTVDVAGNPVRIKRAFLDGEVVNAAPEHDDCVAVARSIGGSVKNVWVAALTAARDT